MDKKKEKNVDVREQLIENFNQVGNNAKSYLINNKFVPKEEDINIKNVIRYNKKIELTKKDSDGREKDEFTLYVVELEYANPEMESENSLKEIEFLVEEDENGKIQKINSISDLIQEYEGFENIKDVVDKTKENEEKPKEEQDEEYKKDSLEELEAEQEKEECAETLEEDEDKIKKIAEIKNEKDDKKLAQMNHLQEIDADTRVNYYKDMEKALGLKGVQKFVIVYSEDAVELSDTKERNSSRYSMIAVMDDGSKMNLDDKLEEVRSEGTNSDEGRIQTDADEKTGISNNLASMYRIKGSSSNETFSFEQGQYGEIKAYYGNMTKADGTTFVGTQLETSSVWPTSTKVKEQASDRAGKYYADEKKDETEKHLEHGDEEVSIENSDGREETKELCENQIDMTLIEKYVEEILENESINETYTEREVREYLLETIEKNPNKEPEEIKETVEYDLDMTSRERNM